MIILRMPFEGVNSATPRRSCRMVEVGEAHGLLSSHADLFLALDDLPGAPQ
jgi:hypothetical protein